MTARSVLRREVGPVRSGLMAVSVRPAVKTATSGLMTLRSGLMTVRSALGRDEGARVHVCVHAYMGVGRVYTCV
jgi:hypothetical protein